MNEMAQYNDVVVELERLLTDECTDLSSVISGEAPGEYYLLPQGGVVEFQRLGRHGLQPASEEAVLRFYDLDGTCIASFIKGFEPWHIFAMALPRALFDVELHALRHRPNFLARSNWQPRSLADELLSATRYS